MLVGPNLEHLLYCRQPAGWPGRHLALSPLQCCICGGNQPVHSQAQHRSQSAAPQPSICCIDFWHCVKLLWRDLAGQRRLAHSPCLGNVPPCGWIVLDLDHLDSFNLEQATRLIAIVCIRHRVRCSGLPANAVQLRQAFKVLPAGILMGGLVVSMLFVHNVHLASVLMFLVGASWAVSSWCR